MLWAAFLNVPIVGLVFPATTVGWFGVQRAWYQRLFSDERMHLGEVPRMLRAYFRRFLTLGARVMVILFIPFILLVVLAPTHPGAFRLGLIAISLATDFALTFVTPALALTTDDAREATSIGIDVLRETWPSCALYVLVPPVAVETLFYLFGHGPWRLAGTAVTAVFALMCKGATVRFYVRRRGAADPIWRPVDRSLEL